MILVLLFNICLVLFVLGLIFEIYKKFDRSWILFNKLPTPPSYPVFGNTFSMIQSSTEATFIEERRKARKYGPIYGISLVHIKIVVLLHPADIEQIMTNMKHITKSRIYEFLHKWLGTGLLTSTGEKWQKRRKILTPAFHFNILQDFIKVFNEETKNLVQVLKKDCTNGVIDVVRPITQFTLLSINETAMGTKLSLGNNDTQAYKNAIYKAGELLVKRAPKVWLYNDIIYGLTKDGRDEAQILKSLHDVSNHVIKQRAKTFNREEVLKKQENASYSTKKRLAMLDLLLSAMYDGKIDQEGIREEVDTFMFEGHDTTSMAICFALLEIANHKEIQDNIVHEIQEVLGYATVDPTYQELNDLKYLDRVLKEVLRMHPSVPLISRISGEEYTTTTGYTIPKGTFINLPIYDVHHNPELYPDPEKFDPDRFLPENTKIRHPFAYIPFSGGPRNCIGQKFAMLELKAVLVGILREFVLEPVDKPKDIRYITDLVLRPNENGINVKFVPRIK